MIFGGLIAQWVIFPWASRITQFQVVWTKLWLIYWGRQNTLKLGVYVKRGIYKKTGIDWVIKKLWNLVCWYINELSFKCLLNRLNPRSVEKVMVILLRLHRLDWNCAHLYSTLILGTLLCESCFCPQWKF